MVDIFLSINELAENFSWKSTELRSLQNSKCSINTYDRGNGITLSLSKGLPMEGSKLEQKDMVKPLRSFRKKKWSKIDRDIAGSLFFVHILCIFAPFHFNWSAFWVAFVLYVITGLFGISISYHRNLAHRSFILPKWLEYLFAYCGVHALQVCSLTILFLDFFLEIYVIFLLNLIGTIIFSHIP